MSLALRLEGRAGLQVMQAHGKALRSGVGLEDRILAINTLSTPDRKAYEAALATLGAAPTWP